MSVGGSVLFSKDHPELNREFFSQLTEFLDTQIAQNHSVVMIIGGGILARIRQEDARHFGVTDKKTLDKIGLYVTKHNASYIQDILEAEGKPAKKYVFEKILSPGWIYVRGGRGGNHTSDYTAVKAAVALGSCTVFNISTNPGIFAFTETGFDESKLLEDITFDHYLGHVPEHRPGINVPFDSEAAKLAKEHDIQVILVGPDMKNLTDCINGKDFIGTVMHN